MGFSTIGSFIIMFFAIVIVVSTFILIFGSLVESTNLTYDMQKERIDYALHSGLSILGISYDNVTNTTIINATNTGENKIVLDTLDVYIDDIKIPRSTLNRTITFHDDSTVLNPLHWDPDENIMINISMHLENVTHVAVVSTDFGIKDTATFSG
jgi:archaellum component FlaF (FlaF/FlaG flagellin family)